jgi:hypothetical protein
MPRVGFEPMNPVFELAKTVHTLDRAATLIGDKTNWGHIISNFMTNLRTSHGEVMCLTNRGNFKIWGFHRDEPDYCSHLEYDTV